MKLSFTVLRFGVEDDQGDVVHHAGCYVPEKVKVSRNFQDKSINDRLGIAELVKLPDRVVAHWEYPGVALPPCRLYPAVGGALYDVFQHEGKQRREIKKCRIMEIAITTTPNADPEIDCIQNQNKWAPVNGALDAKPSHPVADKGFEHVGTLKPKVKTPAPGSD